VGSPTSSTCSTGTSKRADDLERLYQLPLLATIPQRSFGSRGSDPTQEHLEPYKILHANLETLLAKKDAYLVIVTSAISMEGKSTVAPICRVRSPSRDTR